MGIPKRDDRPMGVAVRTYYTSPRHDDDWLESWLELWDRGTDGRERLLPGYGWIFGVGDGTSNVGLGILNTSTAWGKVDYKDLLKRWLDQTPEEWGYREENRTQPVRGAALPMGFNRQPHYTRGLLLVGDSGGMVNPFNGEGIAYAMESGELAAEIIAQALARPTAEARERALAGLPADAEGRLRRLLHGRPGVREADRRRPRDEAGDPSRAAPSGADALRAQADGQPHRPARRRRDGQGDQRPVPARRRLNGVTTRVRVATRALLG